jgi:hypothetical protein
MAARPIARAFALVLAPVAPAFALVLVPIAPAACSRGSSEPAQAPAPTQANASELAPVSALALGPASAPAPPAAGEANRSTISRLEADVLLLPHLAALRDHFGAGAKGPFDVQRIELTDGRTAVLVSHPDESDPFVLAFDRDQLLGPSRAPPPASCPP